MVIKNNLREFMTKGYAYAPRIGSFLDASVLVAQRRMEETLQRGKKRGGPNSNEGKYRDPAMLLLLLPMCCFNQRTERENLRGPFGLRKEKRRKKKEEDRKGKGKRLYNAT